MEADAVKCIGHTRGIANVGLRPATPLACVTIIYERAVGAGAEVDAVFFEQADLLRVAADDANRRGGQRQSLLDGRRRDARAAVIGDLGPGRLQQLQPLIMVHCYAGSRQYLHSSAVDELALIVGQHAEDGRFVS